VELSVECAPHESCELIVAPELEQVVIAVEILAGHFIPVIQYQLYSSNPVGQTYLQAPSVAFRV